MGETWAATAAAAVNDLKETSAFITIADLLTQLMQLLGKSEFIGLGVAIVGLLTLRATMKIGKVEKNTNSLVSDLLLKQAEVSEREGKVKEQADQADREDKEDEKK